MNTVLPPFAALRAFEAVGRLGGIRRAALSLGISHAIVSRHLRQLEVQLGRILFDRTAGRLTDAGLAYHASVSASIANLALATDEVRGSRSAGLVIWCAPGLAAHWLTFRLQNFTSSLSSVLVDLRVADKVPDFNNNDADGDIRYLFDGFPQRERGVRHVDLARPRTFPVASPKTAARLGGALRTASDLLAAPRIVEGGDEEWLLWFDRQGVTEPLGKAVARYGHAHLTIAAARAGQGIALGNHYLVADDLAAGTLVEIETTERPLLAVPLGSYVFRSAALTWSDPQIVRFRTWLKNEFVKDQP